MRLAATKALLASLEFIKKNFDNEQERNFIMQVRPFVFSLSLSLSLSESMEIISKT